MKTALKIKLLGLAAIACASQIEAADWLKLQGYQPEFFAPKGVIVPKLKLLAIEYVLVLKYLCMRQHKRSYHLNLLELGSKVKQLRKEKSITQEELAKQAKISRATLSKLENGNIAQVSIVTLNAILNHLGYELDIKPSNSFLQSVYEEVGSDI